MKLTAAILLAASLAMPSVLQSQVTDSSRVTAPPAKPRDSFIGLDKPKHFLLSFFIESAAFSTFQAAGANRRTSGIAATAMVAGFGVGRELHDRRTKGLFSFGDLLWDALGAGAAAVMLRHTYR